MQTPLTIPELLHNNEKNISISVEILPPVRGDGINGIFSIIDEIRQTNPLWIDVTSHSSSVEWIPESKEAQIYRKNQRRKTPGTIAICGAINYKYNIPAVPHVLCKGFSREETEDALIDLNYLGIKNVLAIRGDGVCDKPNTLHCKNKYASDLIVQIKNMNRGIYLDQNAAATDFCVGGACYPEKHIEAANMHVSNQWLVEKQKKGIDYAVTQMFFNNEKFFSYYENIKKDINIPIIPGIKIITALSQLSLIPKHFFIDLPQALVDSMSEAENKEACRQAGVDWTVQQCLELIEQGHKHLHFYIMRNTRYFLSVIEELNSKFAFIG